MDSKQSTEKRFALLIDADNVSAKYIKPIMDELSKYGTVTYKRIYGDWTLTLHAKWKDALLENSITPIQQFGYTQGKNATDSAMIIDAMDILYTHSVDGFCIVSSDSDFTRLAARIRESGLTVIGMGEKKTPTPFRKACDIFTTLELLVGEHGGKARTRSGSAASAQSGHTTGKDEIEQAVVDIITDNQNNGKATGLGEVGSRLLKRYPDFDVRSYGTNLLSKLLDEFVRVKITKDGSSVAVELADDKVREQPPAADASALAAEPKLPEKEAEEAAVPAEKEAGGKPPKQEKREKLSKQEKSEKLPKQEKQEKQEKLPKQEGREKQEKQEKPLRAASPKPEKREPRRSRRVAAKPERKTAQTDSVEAASVSKPGEAENIVGKAAQSEAVPVAESKSAKRAKRVSARGRASAKRGRPAAEAKSVASVPEKEASAAPDRPSPEEKPAPKAKLAPKAKAPAKPEKPVGRPKKRTAESAETGDPAAFVRQLIGEAGPSGIALSELSKRVRAKFHNFKVRDLGYTQFKGYVLHLGDVELEKIGKETFVRLGE